MLAVGVDLVEVARIEGMVARHGQRFLQRIYTDEELRYCAGRLPQLAARFAAKEALSKLLGSGVVGLRWQDLEVLPDGQGKPLVRLHGPAQRRAAALGLQEIAISLSHTEGLAIAFAVGQG
ncbi:MAG: holo-ACP synthase [Chloroflexi bacterium]|nr:holo-ACP synthase [Chloroflexota bacterium]